MLTKCKRLSKIHTYSCEQMSQCAQSLKEEKIKKLDMTGIPLNAMSLEQITALGKMVCNAEIEFLYFKQNGIGKLSLTHLKALGRGIENGKLKNLSIEDNQLYLPGFSEAHWQELNVIVRSLKLESLSLQYNRLNSLEEGQFEQLKELIKCADEHPCLISHNDWQLNRWNALITTKKEKTPCDSTTGQRSFQF